MIVHNYLWQIVPNSAALYRFPSQGDDPVQITYDQWMFIRKVAKSDARLSSALRKSDLLFYLDLYNARQDEPKAPKGIDPVDQILQGLV